MIRRLRAEGASIVYISHRLNEIIDLADRIVVLEAGRIVEQGTHAALIARDGVYARLHSLQFAATVPAPATAAL